MDQRQSWEGEQLVLCRDRATGMRAVIAVDDTTLGPGLGGVRYASYPSEAAAVAECGRLAAAMTLKNAVARLPYGGAKSVILRDEREPDRRAVMRAFGRFVARLGGSYVPGVDMGTTTDDLAEMATFAPDVTCHDQDPSPWTALGVCAGIRAAMSFLDGVDDLTGVRVVVQGAGHVGSELARLLCIDGADVAIADVDPRRARTVADALGARIIRAGDVIDEPCDVFAPCAVAKVVDEAVAGRLGCRVIAGAANDTLATRRAATTLAENDITYVPDFLLNAGGVIHIHALRAEWSEERLRSAVLSIGTRVRHTLRVGAATGVLPVQAAETAANAALGRSPTANPVKTVAS